MLHGQASLGHPPWRGGGGWGVARQRWVCRGSRGGKKRDLNALRLDASANSPNPNTQTLDPIHTNKHIYIYIYIYVYMYICIYVYMYICMCKFRHTNSIGARTRAWSSR